MPLAFALLGLTVLLVTSGLKGSTIADVFQGKASDPLDPAGGTSFRGLDLALPNETDSAQATGGTALKPGVVLNLTRRMDEMTRAGKRYQWGGGHLGYDKDGPWDCSGAVSEALHSCGLLNGPPRVSTGFMAYGKSGPGKRITVAANPTHVFLIVDGKSWTTTSTGTSPKWMPHTTKGFVLRHPEGY